ncbi:hypothetical protein J437_LFUL008689 [Ladona fulva]|uniref:CHHC U11-48K-type domain-containing protein n=1 Tax=Ladona fulva TaxID=123851 RepID=A0A8K0K5E6_LADFU|nr:hypothetical protein J437_LFUL008689 [Ladona fulva]
MSIDISAREQELRELRQFICNARKRIKDITAELQWEPKSLENGKEMVLCPLDEGHVISKANLEEHLEKCKMRKEGYDPEDVQFPPISADPSSASVLKIDRKLQASILKQAWESKPYMLTGYHGEVDDRQVPWSSDRFMSTFTPDEKSALHSHVIANTVGPGEGKDIPLNDQDLEINYKNKKEEKKEKTPLEKLIEERDAKRRKEGKKVHINRKTHTEIIREVILNQMEVYVEWLKAENLLEEDKSETAQPEKVSEHPEEGEIKNVEFEGENDCINSKEDVKKSFMGAERESIWENGQHVSKGRDFDRSDLKWKSERRMGSNSWSSDSRDEGKRHRNYESFRYRDYESSRHKDYDHSRRKDYESPRNVDYNSRNRESYERKRKRDHKEDRNYDCDDDKPPKNQDCEQWSDDRPKIKEEYDVDVHEGDKESIHSDRKQDKERKHHKKKRHHHDSGSEIDGSSKHKKKKKKHKRSD